MRRQRKVQTGTDLTEVGRGQVRGDPPQRELESAVDESGPHPLPCLPYRRVGKADDLEGRQPPLHIDLHPDHAGGDCLERE
jgi:hypothetical protein